MNPLLIIAMLAGFSAQTQTDSLFGKPFTFKLDNKVLSNLKKQNGLVVPMLTTRVRRLPLDDMPCIVPELITAGLIPNAFKGEVGVPYIGNRPRIPNRVPITITRDLNNNIVMSPAK